MYLRLIGACIVTVALTSCGASQQRIEQLNSPPDPFDSDPPTFTVDVHQFNSTFNQRALVVDGAGADYSNFTPECDELTRAGWNLLNGGANPPVGYYFADPSLADRYVVVANDANQPATIFVIAEDDGGIAEIRIRYVGQIEVNPDVSGSEVTRSALATVTPALGSSGETGSAVRRWVDPIRPPAPGFVTETVLSYVDLFEEPYRRQAISTVTIDRWVGEHIDILVTDGNGDTSEGRVYWLPFAKCGFRR